jgi:hypothetical protein
MSRVPASRLGGPVDPSRLDAQVFERYPGAASAPLPKTYQRRRPDKTPLYEAVRANLATLLERAEQDGGFGYPAFVEHEFRRFLDCGVLARGFARLRCPDCGHERLLAFSCKGRCLCPGCMGRRMAATAAQLVDERLPQAPYRQWVFTVPFALRFALATDRRFLTATLNTFLRTVFAWQRQRALALGIDLLRQDICLPSARAPGAPASALPDLEALDLRQGQPGSVTFIQRFGGALNLNIHAHAVTPDGLFVPPGTNTDTDTDTDTDTGTDTGADQDKNDTAPPLLFVPLPPPTEQDIHELLARIARRIVSIAPRYRVPTHVIERLRMQLGMQDDPRLVDRDDLADLDANDASQDPRQALLEQTLHSALAAPSPERSTATAARCEAQAELASIESTAPLDAPASTLCARLAGFSLHAARTVDAEDRAGLERLCRYGLRPPFAADRLSIDPDGRVRYRLRKPWPTRNGGQRHELVLDPVDFLRRLAALVPPPYFNTVRYHGIFASRNRLHRRLPRPWPRSPETATPAEASATADPRPRPQPRPSGAGAAGQRQRRRQPCTNHATASLQAQHRPNRLGRPAAPRLPHRRLALPQPAVHQPHGLARLHHRPLGHHQDPRAPRASSTGDAAPARPRQGSVR